ncbi:GlxA family transcriptional regulator, partial [Pseudomonas sp. SST3]
MHVTLLLADQCSAASATLAMEMLSAANLFADSPPFEVTLASLDGLPVTAWGGQCLQVQGSLAQIAHTDLVLIPGFLFTLKEAMPTFATYGPWLREQHGQGAVLASMCTAAFMLAETGLLHGLRATTHWAFAGFFRRRYAQVSLDERQILCEENRLVTCGGATAA